MVPALIARGKRAFERVKFDSSINQLVYDNANVDPASLDHFGSEKVMVYELDGKSSLMGKYYARALEIASNCEADLVEVKREPEIRSIKGTSNFKIEEVISLYLVRE
jgi:hypothetical protein